MTVSIAAIVPTRHRTELAISAVRSLLDQDCAIEIFLSDNSASPTEALRALARNESRVRYLRPERELGMSEHWDWAMRQAMEQSHPTHFTLHYDRKYSKPRHWGAMAALIAQRPELLVTYAIDSVADEPPPLRLWQTPWTGRTWLIETARVATLVAAGRMREAGQAIPILSNCVVPRAILQSIVARFGDLCRSTTADACFNARFLALHDRFLHCDRSLAVMYAAHRSAAIGYLGAGGRDDFHDYEKLWGDRPWLDAALIPGLNLGQNMYFHEYELVRRETGDRLPPLDRTGYLNELGDALQWVRDPAKRAALRTTLEQHGWSGEVTELPKRPAPAAVRDAVMRFFIERFGLTPRSVSGFAFSNDETALQYALKYPRRPQKHHRHLAALEPVEVPPS